MKTEIGSASVTHGDPGRALAPAPALVLVSVLARAGRPRLAVFLPGPAILVSAAHADPALIVVTACGLELPGAAVVASLGLTAERHRHPFAKAVDAERLGHPACVAQHAGYSAAWSLSLQTPPVFPAEGFPAVQAFLAPPAPYSVGARSGHAVGNGNSAFESPADAPLAVDTDPLSTAAGRQATGRARGQHDGSICPNRFCAVPTHGPSDDPSVAARHAATRESTREAGGSNARGFAG